MRYRLQEQVGKDKWALREHCEQRLVFDELGDAGSWLSFLRATEPTRKFRIIDTEDGGRPVPIDDFDPETILSDGRSDSTIEE